MRVDKSNFKELQQAWYQKLREAGFKDLETPSGNLKSKDIRTQNYQNRGALLEFFLALDSYINRNHDLLHPRDKDILTKFSDGIYIKEIAVLCGCSRTTVKETIRQHKAILLGQVILDKPD